MTAHTTIRFSTFNGDGEATRERGEPWLISAPCGDLRFDGTARQCRARIREWVEGAVTFEPVDLTTPSRAAGKCHDCGDPAPVGLYQCPVCHKHARAAAGMGR